MTVVAIEGPRLLLRDIRIDDASNTYLAWMQDPEVTRFLESRFPSYTMPDLVSYISAMREDPDVRFLAIVLRYTGRHIGNVKLGPIDRHHRRADIGILIGEKDCWGQGYATEAISLLTDWAFAELGLGKLTAGAYASNLGSIRAFERAGFEIEAVRRRHYDSDGEMVDGVLLARFAAESPVP